MLIVAIILGVILGVILLFIILLAIPIDLIFCIEKDADFRSRVRVQWMFGLIGKDISRKKKRPAKEKKKRRINVKSLLAIFKTRRFLRKRSTKILLAIVRTRGFLRKLAKFIRSIFKLLNMRDLKLNLQIGLDDPADTGLLFAVIGPAMVFTRSFSSLDVQIEPNFEQEKLQGYFKGGLRVFPIRFIKPFIIFVFSVTTIRVIKSMIMAIRK